MGGYAVVLSDEEVTSKAQVLRVLSKLKEHRWLDDQTTNVTIHVSLFNAHSATITRVYLEIEFQIGGHLRPLWNIESMFLDFPSAPETQVVIAFEIISMVWLIWLTVKCLRNRVFNDNQLASMEESLTESGFTNTKNLDQGSPQGISMVARKIHAAWEQDPTWPLELLSLVAHMVFVILFWTYRWRMHSFIEELEMLYDCMETLICEEERYSRMSGRITN